MNERIKALRKQLGLTQADFGTRIGVKANTITNYETGLRTPSDAVILSICREFGVSEIWLRTGAAEMFDPLSRDEKIAAFLGTVMHEEDSYKKRFIAMLSKLDEKEWALLEKMAQAMADEGK